MGKSNFDLLKELKLVLQNSKNEVPMSYFDEEDKRLLARIDESKTRSESLTISQEKLNTCFSL